MLLLCGILVSAKGFKINSKIEIRPFTIKIEKIENNAQNTLIYGCVKQQERFSYSILFEDCLIITSDNPNGIKGKLVKWNDDKKITHNDRTVSNSREERFVLEFPSDILPQTGAFSLRIGTIQNRAQTPIIIENISLKKK